jgi:hypothetical protein
VLYLHSELSPAEIKERTLAATQGIPQEALKSGLRNFIQGRDLNVHLITNAGHAAIESLLRLHRPEDVVLDPWQGFIPGADENSFKDISNATQFIDRMIEEYHTTFYIPIHQGKDRARGARGHSLIAGWRDTRFRLEPDRNNNAAVKVIVEPRWATPPPPFKLKFRDGTMWPEASFPPQAMKIREFVKTQGGKASKTAIGDLLELGGESLRKALQRAENEGAINIEKDSVIVKDAIAGPETDKIPPIEGGFIVPSSAGQLGQEQ